MPREVAHQLLVAQAAAWPLASPGAFRLQIDALERSRHGVLEDTTRRLARDLEEHLRPRVSGMSLEVLRQLRDAVWFPNRRGEVCHRVTMAAHAATLAATLLTQNGGKVCLLGDGHCDEADRIERWRWVSLCLPPDLLIAAACAAGPIDAPADSVTLASPMLERLLDSPVAQTHLHVGAAVSFGVLWTGLTRTLAAGLSKGTLNTRLLTAAMLSRVLMATYLRHRRPRDAPRDEADGFRGFMRADDPQRGLRRVAEALDWAWGPADAHRALLGAAEVLFEPHRGVTADDAATPLAGAVNGTTVRMLYRRLIGPEPDAPADACGVAVVACRDPLSDWLARGPGLALPEVRFARRALAYLLSDEGREDAAFAGLFWQYERIRSMVYSHLVEEPGTAGLDWFATHYGRVSPLRGALEKAMYASALELESEGLRLSSLEARTSPESSWTGIRDLVRKFASQAVRHEPMVGLPRPEVGLVLHFIKDPYFRRGGREYRLQADPRHKVYSARFGPWYRDRLREALAIESALRYDPRLLLVLRGLDAASTELSVPTWVLVPLFQRVRRASVDAAHALARARPRWAASPLRQTVHAGEDYRRLVEGLRRVHELVDFEVLRPGDRIGHGFALGVDPERWVDGNASVLQPKEERLDDLLWELECYGRGQLPPDLSRLEFARAQAAEFARDIYDRPRVTIDDFIEARRLRHDPAELKAIGYPARVGPGQLPGEAHHAPRAILRLYLSDPDVFERGQEPIPVAAHPHEVRLLREIQRWMRRALGRLEITVETNPSSNLLIGDLLRMEDHPLFRLQPLPGKEEPGEGSVMVSVNDDDPVTFATRLADEYAYLYAALIRSGLAAQEALEYIDRLRGNGWRSRFTVAASADEVCLRDVASERRP